MSSVGYITAIGSAICNGSFAALSKATPVVKADLHPLIFQLYVCIGVFLSSWMVVPFLGQNDWVTYCAHTDDLDCADVGKTYQFTAAGLLAGLLLVLAITFSFFAIPLVGLSIAQGTWGGTAIVVSFFLGLVAFDNTVSKPFLAFVALCLLLVGGTGIAFCEPLAQRFAPAKDDDDLSNDAVYRQLSSSDGTDPLLDDGALLHKSDTQRGNRLSGILLSLVVGLCGGSILVPLQIAPAACQGLVFVPSFGIGALLAGPLVAGAFFWWNGQRPALHFRETAPYGIASGVIWNAGNVLSIFGIPRIGYSVAYPILQCALFVSGIWGIFYFHEIRGQAVTAFFLSGAVLILGALVLALSSTPLPRDVGRHLERRQRALHLRHPAHRLQRRLPHLPVRALRRRIFYFHEIRGQAVTAFFLSGAVLILGALVLALSS